MKKLKSLIDWEKEFKDSALLDWESWEGFGLKDHISLAGTGAIDSDVRVHQRGETYADIFLKDGVVPEKLKNRPIVFSKRRAVTRVIIDGEPFSVRDLVELDPVRYSELQYQFHIPPVLGYDVLIAYLEGDCIGLPGQGWDYRYADRTKVETKAYSDGSLVLGPDLPHYPKNNGFGVVFGTLEDGRIISADNRHIYLESSPSSGSFSIAGLIYLMPYWEGSPVFLKVSPDFSKIAFGTGFWSSGSGSWYYYDNNYPEHCPLLIINVSALSTSSPPVLFDADLGGSAGSGVTMFNVINGMYDVVWWDNQFLLGNKEDYPTPEYPDFPFSMIGAIDTLAADPSTYTGFPVIVDIGGSSSGLALDINKNLIAGIGFNLVGETGSLKIFDSATIADIVAGGSYADYSTGLSLTQSLSAGHMVVDDLNNLFVGGGQYWDLKGVADPSKMGHIEKIPLGDTLDLTDYAGVGEKEIIIVDPCQDDSAAGPLCLIPKGIIGG